VSGKVVYSKQNAYVAIDGQPRAISFGETVDAEDPVVRLYPSMFTDDPTPFQRNNGPVSNRALETASADPGEKRVARRAPQE